MQRHGNKSPLTPGDEAATLLKLMRTLAVMANEAFALSQKLIGLDAHYGVRRLLLKMLSRRDLERAQREQLSTHLALAIYTDLSLNNQPFYLIKTFIEQTEHFGNLLRLIRSLVKITDYRLRFLVKFAQIPHHITCLSTPLFGYFRP